MNVSLFKHQRVCDKASKFQSIVPAESERYLVLASFLNEFSEFASKEWQKPQINGAENFCNKAKKLFQSSLNDYKSEWFSQDLQMQERKRLDTELFDCFLHWFVSYMGTNHYVCNHSVKAGAVFTHDKLGDKNEILEKGEPIFLEQKCHLIIAETSPSFEEPLYDAMLLSFSKTEKGLKGKKPKTNLLFDPVPLTLKAGLEKNYRGVSIMPVYIGTNETKGEVTSWIENETAASNLFHLSYEDCIEDNGEFQFDLLNAKMVSFLEEKDQKNCSLCFYNNYCKMQTESNKRKTQETEIQEKKAGYVMPHFDEYQRTVVEHLNGPMLCCAGPGSGKTASLVGRVKNMVEHDLYPENMLLISFTEKAARELTERISSFLYEDEMPRICTLNALGMEIILLSDKLRGTIHRLLTPAAEQHIIKNMLLALDKPLTGVNYKSFTGNAYSTVATVSDAVKKYAKGIENRDDFFARSQYNVEEFSAFADTFIATIEASGYISYDEQIKLATEILKTDEEIADMVESHYRYIMVDEFQDINGAQYELICALTRTNNNIVCIGDDDQAIYSWRGGSSIYMEQFPDNFPGAKVVRLQNNYRSAHKIVTLCNEILDNCDTSERIEKRVVCANEDEGLPIPLIDSNTSADVEDIIKDALSHGFNYGDIAIIATKNSDLVSLHETLSFPTTLASAFVRNDFLFNAVYYALGLALDLIKPLTAMASLGLLYEMNEQWFVNLPSLLENNSVSFDPVFYLKGIATRLVEEKCKPAKFIARLAVAVELEDSVSEASLLRILEQARIDTLGELYAYLHDMSEFMDDSRLEYPSDGNITLITAHSAKGKEYPVVIVYDTDSYEGHIAHSDKDKSQDLRLLYVSVSRAKNMLFLMKKHGTTSLLDVSPNVCNYLHEEAAKEV